jgi:PadR family transcriptional regulator, regulatory protein PadR
MPGTLNMLSRQTLTRDPLHRYWIAQSIESLSDDVLTVEDGSLYPPLPRLLLQGRVKGGRAHDGDELAQGMLRAGGFGPEIAGIELSRFDGEEAG